MDGVLDFFGSEAGQRRRAALDNLSRNIGYYIPPELRGLLGVAAQMTPTSTLERAAQASERMFGPDRTASQRVGDLGAMLSETAGIAAPVLVAGRAAIPAAQAVQEGLLGFSMGAQDVGRAVADRLNQPGQMPTLYSNPLLGPIGAGSGGIRAYQGSPHDFAAERLVRYPDGRTEYIVGRPDVLPDVPAGAEVLQDFPMGRMRMDKIGTGEGAQAYGHGLYTAEAEEVARGYRDALTARAAPNDARGNAFDLVQRMGGDVEATAEIVRDSIANVVSPNTEQFLRETLKHLEEGTFANFERPLGRMYEVNIRANPEDFLDWDRPLSEQTGRVANLLADYEALGSPVAASTGQDWMLQMGRNYFREGSVNPAADVSAYLAREGIPGVRYLDAGSRYIPSNLPDNPIANEARAFLDMADGDAQKAMQLFNESNPIERFASVERDEVRKVIQAAGRTPTRNYVVFDENLINIVRKYGIAGAAALLGLSIADIEAAMAAPAPNGLLAQEPKR